MTIQEIIQQAQTLSITDQVRLVSQLIQLLERTLQLESKHEALVESKVESNGTSTTADVAIIAELIKNPVPFEGSPIAREEIYDR